MGVAALIPHHFTPKPLKKDYPALYKECSQNISYANKKSGVKLYSPLNI